MHHETNRHPAGRGPARRPLRRALACAGLAAAILATNVPAANAFKPYTHAQTGDAVLVDVMSDGSVNIAGKEYPVDEAVVDALSDHQEFYNAGVIGPDGFPDLTYGQSVIHSEDTGLWLRHIFESAWAAQSDPDYDATERSQILAFAYGYLMHAAGDTWAHTLVNELAEGVFPPVGDVLTDAEKRAIALRHLIVEGYIGDATPGYDSNPDRGPAPYGDVSDDSTPGIDFPTAEEFGGVKEFLYETLIDPNADTPSDARGPVIDYFLGLRANLVAAVDDWDPQPIETLVQSWEDAKGRFDNLAPKVAHIEALAQEWADCAIDDTSCSRLIIGGAILVAVADLGLTGFGDSVLAAIDMATGALSAAADTLALAVDAIFDAYLVAWIDDIDAGLREWAEVGRASTVALFSPQARRDLQNDKCEGESPNEDDQLRISCEGDIGFRDVLFDQADPFINDHLLSMLGFPDAVGDIRQALQDLSGEIDDLLEPITKPLDEFFRPLNESIEDMKEVAKELLLHVAEDALGVDFDTLQSFLSHPAQWMDVEDVTVDLPVLGETEIQDLFHADTREKLDARLGFEGTDHLIPAALPFEDFPLEAPVRLKDDAEFDVAHLPVFQNAVTMGKLLLLDGPTLDQVMSDLTGHEYSYFAGQPHANIMLTGLEGIAGADPAMWLNDIDADHAWRADSQPTFPAGTPSGGEGNFPLWESCVLRDDVFRELFVDWESGDAQFPDLGDTASADPNDADAPTSTLVVGGNSHTAGATTYLGDGGTLTVDAEDDFWFDDEIDVAVTVTDADGTVTGTMQEGDQIDLTTLADGPVQIQLQATDPCRQEAVHTQSFVVDTTAPEIVVESPSPEGRVFDTDDLSAIGWTSDDGLHGSGVASESVTFDGGPAAHGDVLDMFLLDPGAHTVVVTASDHLGNTASSTRTFTVRATAESLAANVERAYEQGLITEADVRRSLADKVAAARKAHDRGKHATEHNALAAFVSATLAQRGKAIDPLTADRFIAYAEDLVANQG